MTKLLKKINDNEAEQETGLGNYSTFDQINGDHPLKKEVPNSFVEYSVRARKGGRVAFFNFHLAKTMGLIPKNHKHEMNKNLEEKIIETFGLVIINEYDQIHNLKFEESSIKKNKYMATRYLQLQHPDKRGKTSGDGRSIWNGQFYNSGHSWDISSSGTGATRLSPATSINNKFYQTGDPNVSYGCGYSEIDEGISALFFSEILDENSVNTERVLAILEYSGGISINVRAQKNLLRPSHFFRFLKLNDFEGLKNITDYYISHQIKNKLWDKAPTEKNRYDYFLEQVTNAFAKTAAKFEDEYIFCWMDWDGDNILMDGGIIDYGSVRQFGMFHQEYRYDDIQTYSTNILEQKQKAKYIVQTFVQIVEILKTGRKINIKRFNKHKALKQFDTIFNNNKNQNILAKIGFSGDAILFLADHKKRDVEKFKSVFSYFERVKSSRGIYKVEDGITCDAIFCMRDILRELPQLVLSRGIRITDEEFIDIIRSTYAKKKDIERITKYRADKIEEFQTTYLDLVEAVAKEQHVSKEKILLSITMRSSLINKYERVTGDAITVIAHKIIKSRPKLTPEKLYEILTEFVDDQNLNPDIKFNSVPHSANEKSCNKLTKRMLKIVRELREGL